MTTSHEPDAAPPTVGRETEIWSATRTLAMHLRDGRCAMCTREGCRLTTWAQAVRRQAAADGYHLPEVPVRGHVDQDRG